MQNQSEVVRSKDKDHVKQATNSQKAKKDMKNSKVKTGIIVAAVAVGFYLAGAFIGWPNSNHSLMGDIGKAAKYSKPVVDIDVDALQDHLSSDSAYARQMLATVGVMQLHAQQFGLLIDATQRLYGANEVMKEALLKLQKVKATVNNSAEALTLLSLDISNISKGKKVKNFEQDLNNAMLAFMLVSQSSTVAEIVVATADQQLQTNLEEADQALLSLRNEWVLFAMTDAVVAQNETRRNNIEQLGVFRNQEQLGQIFNEEQLGLYKEIQELNLQYCEEGLNWANDKEGLNQTKDNENLQLSAIFDNMETLGFDLPR